jgi:hypothetical protein
MLFLKIGQFLTDRYENHARSLQGIAGIAYRFLPTDHGICLLEIWEGRAAGSI